MTADNDTLTETEFAVEVDRMRHAGAERAKAAATWILDGNSTEGTARAILEGLENGDPMVLDTLPAFSFGEWSGESEREMIEAETDVDVDSLSGDEHDELCNAYLDGFNDEIGAACEREARAFLGLD